MINFIDYPELKLGLQGRSLEIVTKTIDGLNAVKLVEIKNMPKGNKVIRLNSVSRPNFYQEIAKKTEYVYKDKKYNPHPVTIQNTIKRIFELLNVSWETFGTINPHCQVIITDHVIKNEKETKKPKITELRKELWKKINRLNADQIQSLIDHLKDGSEA